MRRLLAWLCIPVVGVVTFAHPAAAQSPHRHSDDCFALGRTFGSGSWSPDGSEFVFSTSDRSTTRLESISFPGMERRTLAEARDPWSALEWPTFTDDGRVLVGSTLAGSARLSLIDPSDPSSVVEVPVVQPDRTWFLYPRAAHGGSAIVSAVDIISSGDVLHRVDLSTGSMAALELPPDLAGRSVRWASAPTDGSFLLLGLADPSGGRHDWWVLRDGSATPLDFGVDVVKASVTDDGSRIFYTVNDGSDPDGVHSVAVDGTDRRTEFRRSDVDDVNVNSQGIAAFGSYVPSFDGAPNLPEPPESNSWTPTSALCFTRTSLAAPDVAYPDALPADDAVAEVVFPEVGDAVAATIASLPREVGGLPLAWDSGAYAEGEPQPLRVAGVQSFTLAMLATASAGLDPEAVWADRAASVGADGLPVSALLSVITDGGTPGSTWAEIVRRELIARDAGALATEATMAGRDVVVVEGLRDAALPEEYAQYPEYAAAIRNYWWPESTTYLVPAEDALYIISTDDRVLAEAVAAGLER